jgi:hypothetical protein
MQEQVYLARSVYQNRGTVELITVKCAEDRYETRLGGEANITMPLFLLSGRTVRRHERQPIETVCCYHTEEEALQGHQRAAAVLQQMYGGSSFTIIPEASDK